MTAWDASIQYLLVISLLIICLIINFIILIISCIRKKGIKKITVVFLVNIVILSYVILFECSHSTYYKYNDWWIVGNHISDVEERYGDFDLGDYKQGQGGRVAYFIYKDVGHIMSSGLDYFYYMEYDKEGIVTEVYYGCPPGG